MACSTDAHGSAHEVAHDDSATCSRPRALSRGTVCSMIDGASLATSGRWFAEPTQTLLFFDWDDTLFPTTEIFDRWGIPSDKSRWDEVCLSDDQQRKLDMWEDAVYQFLSMALSRSERCSIVTNSRRPWVEDCVNRFAPRLRPVFDHRERAPHVIYAREAFQAQQHTTPKAFENTGIPAKHVDAHLIEEEHTERCTAWKYAAMKQEAKSFYSQYPNQTWKNIISVGDMEYEHFAVQDLSYKRKGPSREHIRTKSCVLPKNMSISFMTVVWQWYKVILPLYIGYDGDFTLDASDDAGIDRIKEHVRALNVPELLSLDMPHQIISGSGMDECVTEERCEVLSQALDDLAIVVQDALEY